MYIYIHIYIYIYVHKCICIYTHTYICSYVCMCIYCLGFKKSWTVFVNKKPLKYNVRVYIYTGIYVYYIFWIE